ncbi:hypothetical protein Q7P37_010841 [Cladosporium fusiforme]
MLCKCPKLTPLQSRLAASLLALALVAVVFWSLSNPHFAYAADLDDDALGESSRGEDHNWHRIEDERLRADGIDVGLEEEDELQPRQTTNDPELVDIPGNDAGTNLNIEAGQTERWRYPEKLLHGPYGVKGAGLPSRLLDSSAELLERHNELKRRDVLDDDEWYMDRLAKRQGSSESRMVYISINTCLQPSYNGTGTQTGPPPQLTLYVSTSASNESPGPGSSDQKEYLLDRGFAKASISTSNDLYLAVHAPETPENFTGGWNYEIAVSIDDYYHKAEEDMDNPFMYLVDTDTTSALLVTDNLTLARNGSEEYQEWMNLTSPFMMFASNSNYTQPLGLEKSFCGLRINAQMRADPSSPSGGISHIQMGMTSRGLGNKPKQQFYINGLNSSSGYVGSLAMLGNSTAEGSGVIGGGGTVWPQMNWVTKADGNCALLFDLNFCSEVAYAVPANVLTYPDRSGLAARYDSYASALYQNFTYSLQQIACNASSDSLYSPAKSCEDCEHAYKEWLCAVTIPRCEDFSAEYEWLQPRNVAQNFANGSSLPDEFLNMTYAPMPGAPTLDGSPAWSQTYNTTFSSNRSRNHGVIDLDIMPGPYKEVLPCDDLCYSLMQSCPAKLGIGCPSKGMGLERSYGKRDGEGDVKCSYLGAYFYLNAAGSLGGSVRTVVTVAVVAALVLLV